jgi:multiple sugar transport system ATP-binding protein
MADVRLIDIRKVYENAQTATIDQLSLDIRDGEFMVLVGPSGCGKSTTLRMVAGLEEATAGTIMIGDRIVNDVAPKDRDIAMVFQNYALYPHMTVRENMAFGLKLRKFPKDEIASRVKEAADLLEIADYLERKPKALSGGQRQRVALGRAIVRKPTVFLFDEPLSNLDAKLRVQMRTEIKRLHMRLGTTMIYVTHDQVEAMTMGDRITVMKNGVIHQVDTPINLYEHPADLFVAGFIGNPSMNVLPCTLSSTDPLTADEGGITLRIPETHHPLLAAHHGRSVSIGIRPEHVHLRADDCAMPAAVTLRHDVSELLGNETFMYFTTGRTPVVARARMHTTFALGEQVTVHLDLARAHYFDTASGRRITP